MEVGEDGRLVGEPPSNSSTLAKGPPAAPGAAGLLDRRTPVVFEPCHEPQTASETWGSTGLHQGRGPGPFAGGRAGAWNGPQRAACAPACGRCSPESADVRSGSNLGRVR